MIRLLMYFRDWRPERWDGFNGTVGILVKHRCSMWDCVELAAVRGTRFLIQPLLREGIRPPGMARYCRSSDRVTRAPRRRTWVQIFAMSKWNYEKQANYQNTKCIQSIKIHQNTLGILILWAGKLYRARSRLYRSGFLQPNIRRKALAEIYTMHSFLQVSNLNLYLNLVNCY